MENCLFCKIIRGEIPSNKVYENDYVYAFRDINPQAPVHVLVIPKKHVSSMAAINELDHDTISSCLLACREIAQQEGLSSSGFRVVTNSGSDACQSVHHLHFHVLGGKQMSENMV